MKNNDYTSFFKTKSKKVERYIRCRKCGGNMEWSRDFPPQIKCTKCGYTVYPKPYEPDCIKLPETLEEYFELCEKVRAKMLIRSQDKTVLVKFENIVVNLKLPDSLKVICWSWNDAQRSGGYFVLGKYSTKAKAIKVLDMIQEAYVNGHIDFQMPEDSEVVA